MTEQTQRKLAVAMLARRVGQSVEFLEAVALLLNTSADHPGWHCDMYGALDNGYLDGADTIGAYALGYLRYMTNRLEGFKRNV